MTECSYLNTGEMPLGVSDVQLGSDWETKKMSKPTYENTVIIFDWDDTLLSSSWLAGKGYRLDSPLPKEAVDQLKVLETAVLNLLSKAFLYGEVHFVTNGEAGWVEMSAQKFLPRVYELLPRVNIVSARSTYQHRFPNSPEAWKIEAFRSTIQESFENKMDIETKRNSIPVRNLISFGDSAHERNALIHITSNMKNALCKSIKFVERPSLEQLERQLKIIDGSLEYVCTHNENLDLMLAITMLCD